MGYCIKLSPRWQDINYWDKKNHGLIIISPSTSLLQKSRMLWRAEKSTIHNIVSLLSNLWYISTSLLISQVQRILSASNKCLKKITVLPTDFLFLALRKCHHIKQTKGVMVKVAQSCPTLCNPIDYSPPGSMEFSRQEYWSGLPFLSPGDVPNLGIEPRQILYHLSYREVLIPHILSKLKINTEF